VDVTPGPSVGDAAEFIESLGLDPWRFSSLDLVNEICTGDEWIAEFVVTGSFETLDRLRNLHDKATNSSSAPPRLLEQESSAIPDSVSYDAAH